MAETTTGLTIKCQVRLGTPPPTREEVERTAPHVIDAALMGKVLLSDNSSSRAVIASVQVVMDETTEIILHVWEDSEQVYASEEALLASAEEAGMEDDTVRSALLYARMRPGQRVPLDPNSFYREYLVVFPKLPGVPS